MNEETKHFPFFSANKVSYSDFMNKLKSKTYTLSEKLILI